MIRNSEDNRLVARRRRILTTAVLLILLATAAIWYGVRRQTSPDDSLAGRPVPKVATTPPTASGGEVAADLQLPVEMVERAGLKSTTINVQPVTAALRTTATVQPNAYRETPIMPLVEGRVTRVNVQLGDQVREGQILATIFSAELAEAQMKYLTVDANLQFHANQAKRFEKLADLGAVSRQELEEVVSRLREHHAEHAALKERMMLYGLTEAEILQLRNSTQVRADVPVNAPASGVITSREVNVGQNLTMRDRLFTITDLANIWVVANIYEKDFALLQTGQSGHGRAVSITTAAWPGRQWTGRIGYVDPRVDPATRTALVRIEVPNRDQRLKLGMFVDVDIQSTGVEEALVVPRAAVQEMGEEKIVFVQLGSGRFQVRRVTLGTADGENFRVTGGLSSGEQVVTEGSFFLRAEMGRKR
jgi:cobalt-zinc-cadmium efflux system membrane fusion protein